MSILQDLPNSLCEPGPEHIHGIGNFFLQVRAPAPSQRALSSLYFLDSHGEISSKTRNPDYEHISQSQLDWFVKTSHEQRVARELNQDEHLHLSLAFIHIPIPEYGDHLLSIRNGLRREPTECPSYNSHFYDTLVTEGVSALGYRHDHVNDFCALLPHQTQHDGQRSLRNVPWLCYGGATGFRGYCSYDNKRFHRGARVWELDTGNGSLKTWRRVEYIEDRVDELVLMENGVLVSNGEE